MPRNGWEIGPGLFAFISLDSYYCKMPLPTPNTSETRDDFLSRCMVNSTMRAEYPNQDQRYAVCQSQWTAPKTKAESYTDYPKGASEEAQRALDFKEKNGSNCGTNVGWTRANQLAKREPLSLDTVKRTYSFLSRAKTYDTGSFTDRDGNEVCGSIMYAAWGGDPMLRWTERTLEDNE